mmetsp:Transcript_53627/g.88949  ORF Transcript_53627/g.88949 Transcript_53627/m.88949 type:complete len:201 (+) Transcript_53627:468-1070(+)
MWWLNLTSFGSFAAFGFDLMHAALTRPAVAEAFFRLAATTTAAALHSHSNTACCSKRNHCRCRPMRRCSCVSSFADANRSCDRRVAASTSHLCPVSRNWFFRTSDVPSPPPLSRSCDDDRRTSPSPSISTCSAASASASVDSKLNGVIRGNTDVIRIHASICSTVRGNKCVSNTGGPSAVINTSSSIRIPILRYFGGIDG